MSFSKINLAFKKCEKENRPALLTYIVSGDPNKQKTFEILKKIAPKMSSDKVIVMNMCGRGDKDIFTVADTLNIKI